MHDLSLMARMMEKGLPPIAGGTLDQSHWFLEFCSFLWGEHGRLRAELMAPAEE